MKTFNVIELVGGRVTLEARSATQEESVLRAVEAETWVEARTLVDETGLYQNPGYGWFRR